MLILTRRPGQAFTIQPSPNLDQNAPVEALFSHGPIEVRIRRIEARQVKMGITAHSNLAILRDELALRVPPTLNPLAGRAGISPSHERLAGNLFAMRLQRNWSVKQLAEASKLSVSRLCDIEQGLGEMDLKDLDRLADAFGVDIVELFRAERM